jgi:hypothetical protein
MWFNPFIPRRILIKREKDYHTHYIGQTSDGRQFFGYEAFVFPNGFHTTSDWTKERKEYVVLFTFDKDGNFLTQKHCYLGTTAEVSDFVIQNKLEEFVNEIAPVKYGDIKIKPFKTNIDGHTFGLVSKFLTVDLEPHSSISFHWPWDGEYDT